ncbi:MAG: L-threonylcarbamoyladenylate synthase [Bacteroidota bacterium]
MIVPATPDSIRSAAEQLRSGAVVAIPTETVYGLACAIDSPEAIRRVFELKGRPSDNPLIVHVASLEQALTLADEADHDVVRRRGAALWPGPRTIVVRRSGRVSDAVTAGLNTVAMRMPAHPVTREIILQAGVPLAAPSANLSGRPSPTRAEHVEDDLRGAVMVVDAGPCAYGLESTVVRVLGSEVVILRQGALSAATIGLALGSMSVRSASASDDVHLSPGTRYRHYAPNVPVVLCDSPEQINATIDAHPSERMLVLCSADAIGSLPGVPTRELSASSLFDEFRRAEALQVDRIVVLCDDHVRTDAALLNRLQRAAETRQASS